MWAVSSSSNALLEKKVVNYYMEWNEKLNWNMSYDISCRGETHTLKFSTSKQDVKSINLLKHHNIGHDKGGKIMAWIFQPPSCEIMTNQEPDKLSFDKIDSGKSEKYANLWWHNCKKKIMIQIQMMKKEKAYEMQESLLTSTSNWDKLFVYFTDPV